MKERHLINVPPGWLADEGDTVKIRKVKSNPNLLVTYLGTEIEMHPDEAREYISAAGEVWIPRMFRPKPEDYTEYTLEYLIAAHGVAMSNHKKFKRDAAVYDTMPTGNECYAAAGDAAERWLTIATMMAREIGKRNE